MRTSPSTTPSSSAPSNPTRSSRGRSRRLLPHWWPELLVGAVCFGAYQLVQGLVTGSQSSAVARARSLWQVEGEVHLDPEVTLNQLLNQHPALVALLGGYYATLHFAVTFGVLLWLRVRGNGAYRPLRNTFLVTCLIGLLVYWLLPLAPPRLSIPGVLDTVDPGGSAAAPDPFVDQYAAMPSLHVAWAVWVALAIVVAHPMWRFRHLAWAYPLVTTAVVLATGNHFLADTVAGAALVAGVWFVVGHLHRPGALAPPHRVVRTHGVSRD